MILALLVSTSDTIAFALTKYLDVPSETIEPKWLYTGLICVLYIILWQTFGFLWRKALNISRDTPESYLRYFKNDALSWILPFVTVIAAVFLAGHMRLVFGMEVERPMFVVISFLSVISASEFRLDIEPILLRERWRTSGAESRSRHQTTASNGRLR